MSNPRYVVRNGLPATHRRLTRGLPTTVAFFGSSQTANRGWAEQAQTLLQTRYPSAPLTIANTSQGGVQIEVAARLFMSSVLPRHPQLLFLEFTPVSLLSSLATVGSALEDMITTAYNQLSEVEICYVHCIQRDLIEPRLANNPFPEQYHQIEEILSHYQIPSIHFAEEILARISENNLIFDAQHYRELREQYTKDELQSRMHYSVEGHPLLGSGDLVCRDVLSVAFPALLASSATPLHPLPARLSAPLGRYSLQETLDRFTDDTQIIGGIGNATGTLPDIERFHSLLTLDLTGSTIERYAEFRAPASLEYLNLSLCSLRGACPAVSAATSLRGFSVSQNYLEGAVPDFRYNQELESLVLAHNRFTSFDGRFTLPRLRHLELSNNRFRGIPPDLSQCRMLEVVCLDRNQFTGTIPDFREFPLTTLQLHSCLFTDYQPGSLRIRTLQQISVAANPLTESAIEGILKDLLEVKQEKESQLIQIDLQGCGPFSMQAQALRGKLQALGCTVLS